MDTSLVMAGTSVGKTMSLLVIQEIGEPNKATPCSSKTTSCFTADTTKLVTPGRSIRSPKMQLRNPSLNLDKSSDYIH